MLYRIVFKAYLGKETPKGFTDHSLNAPGLLIIENFPKPKPKPSEFCSKCRRPYTTAAVVNNWNFFYLGRRCDRCISGYWNLESGVGCESCNCHLIGSSTGECDEASGKCECLEGVAGQRCDRCLPNHYGLSRSGCTGKEWPGFSYLSNF